MRELRAYSGYRRNRLEQHIHALLPGQPGNHAEEQDFRIRGEAEPLLQRGLVHTTGLDALGVESRLQMRVCGGVPGGFVDTVEHARKGGAARAQQARESHPACIGPDLGRVGRRYRRDAVGEA